MAKYVLAQHLRYELKDDVAVITFDTPGSKVHSFNPEL